MQTDCNLCSIKQYIQVIDNLESQANRIIDTDPTSKLNVPTQSVFFWKILNMHADEDGMFLFGIIELLSS